MPSILIVDDLQAVHDMLEAVINPAGFHSAFALDGEEALQRYKNEGFDVVLTDMAMQPMDGVTLLQRIKEHDPNAKVIMMTGYASKESAMEALKLGAFDFIEKPFRVEELIEILRKAVNDKEEKLKEIKKVEPVKTPDDQMPLFRKYKKPGDWPSMSEFLTEMEETYRRELMKFCQDNKALASRMSGLSQKEL